MRNIRLIIEYDGKGFNGWQKQPNKLNIQGEIERAIEEISDDFDLHKPYIDDVHIKCPSCGSIIKNNEKKCSYCKTIINSNYGNFVLNVLNKL